ncbi:MULTISPECIES: arsenate reductase ArsC [unclassified Vibrio]|uniref:Arsenate reductase ArsC n=1 Tax=Vibrio sp. HB236076 TaxID=3232307 RepID=A0AB39HGF2_9VIBR|nr:arsenate reductase ArsC [Vibrio sp. HB161653]MDP5252782.1 arsenate reductase ArsC [Vibrio sp. HB161653]
MKILFICRHNSSRSILAEAIAKRYLPAHFEVASGGSHPKGEINPKLAEYLSDNGFDISELRSTSWEEKLAFHPDLIITVCDSMHNETCPNWLSSGIRVAWDLESLPEHNESKSEFYSLCDNFVDHLKQRIERLASLSLHSMDAQELKEKALQASYL